MSLSMYQTSIPVFIRGLGVLSDLLAKADGHAADQGIEPSTLVNARLAPDMYPLSGQVQRASDTSKFAAARLAQLESPRFEDNESTFSELQDRIEKTVAYLKTVDPAGLDGSEERIVSLGTGTSKRSLRGDAYLLTFAIPNFFFHVTTSYAILRHAGVRIGKLDYLGPKSDEA